MITNLSVLNIYFLNLKMNRGEIILDISENIFFIAILVFDIVYALGRLDSFLFEGRNRPQSPSSKSFWFIQGWLFLYPSTKLFCPWAVWMTVYFTGQGYDVSTKAKKPNFELLLIFWSRIFIRFDPVLLDAQNVDRLSGASWAGSKRQ